MKHLQKAVTALLAVVLMMSMLTACVPYEPSAPSVPSVPDNSQGGTENPGENNNTSGGDSSDPDDPDDTPSVAPGWSTSLTKAYLKAKGVSSTDYYVRAMPMKETYDLDGNWLYSSSSDAYDCWAISGMQRMYVEYNKEKPSEVYDGAYTDGQKYYLTSRVYGEDDTYAVAWRQVTLETPDPFNEKTDVTEVKAQLDMTQPFLSLPADEDILTFKAEQKDGGTLETITTRNGMEYSFCFNAENELKKITSKGKVITKNMAIILYCVLPDPEIAPASTSKPFPTNFSDKPYDWTENQGKDEDGNALPTSWAESRIKAYLTKNNITKNGFAVLVEDADSEKMVGYQIKNGVKMLQIGTESGYEAIYSYEDGVYKKYTETDESTGRVLTDAEEIATAKHYFDAVEALAKIPSDVEVVLFRTKSKYCEKFITTDGTKYSVDLDGNGNITGVLIQTTDNETHYFFIEMFKGTTAVSTSVLSSLISMLTSLF